MVTVLDQRGRVIDPECDYCRYLRQLNIDKDILSMRNFNVYDPMKRGQGLILDGQTLSHIEVRMFLGL
jgi:hypothetical protein